VARPYFSSEQLHDVKTATATQIQCQWRGSLARRRARERREELAALKAALGAEAAAAQAAALERQRADLQRRMHPRSQADFGVLFDEVEAWRLAETRRIDLDFPNVLLESGLVDTETPAAKARKAAHVAMQAKESQLIATIERLRLVAAKENNAARTLGLLGRMADPLPVQLSSGDTLVVETPFSERARELKALYEALALPPAAQRADARLEAVLSVKAAAREFDGALVDEIAMLCDREADLLSRGRPQASMEGLRARLLSNWQTFCEDPRFNPGAAKQGRTSLNETAMAKADKNAVPSFLRKAPPPRQATDFGRFNGTVKPDVWGTLPRRSVAAGK
jgi:hypothetical protein